MNNYNNFCIINYKNNEFLKRNRYFVDFENCDINFENCIKNFENCVENYFEFPINFSQMFEKFIFDENNISHLL